MTAFQVSSRMLSAPAKTAGIDYMLKLNPTAAKSLHPGDSIRLPGAPPSATKEAKATTTVAPFNSSSHLNTSAQAGSAPPGVANNDGYYVAGAVVVIVVLVGIWYFMRATPRGASKKHA